jgi:hypothetical protein
VAEIGRIEVQSQPQEIVQETLSYPTQKRAGRVVHLTRYMWLMPVILATGEAKMGKISV